MLRAIAEAVEAERRRKQAETQSETKKEGLSDNKLTHSQRVEKQPERVTQKAAELFNLSQKMEKDKMSSSKKPLKERTVRIRMPRLHKKNAL